MATFTCDFVAGNDPGPLILGDDLDFTTRYSLTWQTGSPAVAVDLTGYTGVFQVVRQYGDLAPQLSAPLVLGGAAGTIQWFVPAATIAAALARGFYHYAVVLTSPAAVVHTLLRGRIQVL